MTSLLSSPDLSSVPRDRPFTATEAYAAGVTARDLSLMTATGSLRRPIKGVYVVRDLADTVDLRAACLAAVVPPGSVVAGWTACWLWTGHARYGIPGEVPPLTVVRQEGHSRLRNKMVDSGQWRFGREDTVWFLGGLEITTPLRTAWDLGRRESGHIALGALDALARHTGVTVEEICGGVERFKGYRGVVRLRVVAPLVDPRAQSGPESALRFYWWQEPSLPTPVPQVEVERHGRSFFLDLASPEDRFAAEYDGAAHHSNDRDVAHDSWRRGLIEGEDSWVIEVFRREDLFGQRADAGMRLACRYREVLAQRGQPPRKT